MSELKALAKKLGIRVIESNWDDYSNQPWLEGLLEAEVRERDKKSLERRIKDSRLGQFKPMADFDWSWPTKIDRELIEELFTFYFMKEKANVVLVSTNGLGKTMIAQNLAYQSLMKGHKTKFIKASHMLANLAEAESAAALKRWMKKFCSAELLVVDEIGYMNYSPRYADLLYEVISERYQKHSTVVTTNQAFSNWAEIFPHAACVVTLVDRLLHNAEVVTIEGESYRTHEASLRKEAKAKERRRKRGRKTTT